MSTTKEVLEKLRGLDAPKLLAVVDGFGGRESMEAWLRGEKRMTLEDVIRKLFDHSGRVIAPHIADITSDVRDENRGFYIELPKLGYAEILERVVNFYPKGTKFISVAEFEDTAEKIRAKRISDPLVANFFKRARPIIFPKHDARKNMGVSLQDFVLPAVQRAYEECFKNSDPKRKFKNYREGKLIGKVSIVPGTGYDELANLTTEKSVVGWYSPNPFQGFSIFAQREAMKTLMQYGFALAGGIDTGTAVIAYTEAMARDYQTPVYLCGALSCTTVQNPIFALQ